MQTTTDMSDGEFVEFCYEAVLNRKPDVEGKQRYLHALRTGGISREGVLVSFITCEEFQYRVGSTEFVPAGHFYSVVPSDAEKKEFPGRQKHVDELPGVVMHGEYQLSLLNKIKTYYDECPFTARKSDGYRYYYDNPAYSYGDALTLYGIMRDYMPKRIVEVGSGFSSCVMLDVNEYFFDDLMNLTFIEPYPDLLHSLIKPQDHHHEIISERVQDVDLDIFSELKRNDILFIDSTHVSKLNSDVNRILFDILPTLDEGVLIHFHDVFWPFEYPSSWVKEGRAWNESYLLHAFLQFNNEFEILFFNDFVCERHADWLHENMPLYMKNTGGSIWLRKIRPC